MQNNPITWQQYIASFDEVLNAVTHLSPYDKPAYLDYLKLNHSRQNRWLKRGELLPELVELIQQLPSQQWVLITEAWCGDAAHSNAFIYKLSELNPAIQLIVYQRDLEPYIIENYLTNGGKSIPILIVRNSRGNDLFVWGPRPRPCQSIFLALKAQNAPFEEQKITLQNWYNRDAGKTLQLELLAHFQSVTGIMGN
jgi:hypothetical protein